MIAHVFDAFTNVSVFHESFLVWCDFLSYLFDDFVGDSALDYSEDGVCDCNGAEVFWVARESRLL